MSKSQSMGKHIGSIGSVVLLAAAAMVGVACADDTDTSNPSGGGGGDGGAAAAEYVVMVRGELFTADLAEAKMAHDAVASGGEAQAMAAGDFGHDALLGTALLGTTESRFLGIDRWDDLQAAQDFYSDPMVAQGFGMLFASPPTLETFSRVDWYGWGDLTAGDVHDPHWFVVIRGKLAEADSAKAQAAHDGIAAQGEGPAKAAGDIAHVVHIGAADPQEFFAVDVWSDDTNIEAFYSNPDFVMAFGTLFSGAPTVQVYASTDWHQW